MCVLSGGVRPETLTVRVGMCVFAACAVTSIALNSDRAALLGLAVLVTAVGVWLLRTRAGGLTVPIIPLVLVNALMIGGVLFWDSVADEAAVSAQLPPTPEMLMDSLKIALIFTSALTAGALLVGPRPIALSSKDTLRLPVGTLVVVGYAILALTIYGHGSALMYAPTYGADGYGGPVGAAIAGTALAPVAILMLAYAVFQPGGHRPVAWLGLAAWCLVLFAMSTRQLALVPAMLVLGRILAPARDGRKLRPFWVGVAVLGTLALAQLALIMRSTAGGVGLRPFWARIQADPGLLADQFDPQTVMGNILFSTPLTAHVAQLNLPTGAFWTSVTPEPTGMTDWPMLAPQFRVNFFTPFNGLGELAAYGPWYLIGYGMAAGAYLALLSRLAVRLSGALRVVAQLMAVGISILFSVTLLQYNLRSDTRLLWYSCAALIGLWMVHTSSGRLRSGPERAHDHFWNLVPFARHH